MMNPVSFPFWFGGLLFYLLSRDAKSYRSFGWAFVITILFFMITHRKEYYSGSTYVMLFAAGAVATERLLAARSKPTHDFETGLFHLVDAWSTAVAAAGVACVADRNISALPVSLAFRSAKDRAKFYWRDIAAVLR